MTCAELETYLPDLAEGAIDAETRARLGIDAHLQTCAGCRAQLAQAVLARRMMVRMRTQTVQVPADFEAHVLARIRAQNLSADLIDFSFSGWRQWLIEIIDLLFDLFLGGANPQPQPAL